MPRGGRSSGGGGGGRSRSFSAPRARAPTAAPAAPNKAGAPSSTTSAGGGAISNFFGRTVFSMFEGWSWGSGYAMGQRAAESVFGPRTFRIEHVNNEKTAAAESSSPSSPCEVHAAAFQDCVNQNGSDISRCQFYINILNDCRRRGQAAIVETS